MKKAFTLAEVLITLAIIGVVAAISIPSVVANTQQKEFQTGLRKAVSVLNSAITMNMALDGESPYENKDLYRYLQRHMSVMQSLIRTPSAAKVSGGEYWNLAFYTTDGMRFEFENDLRKTGQLCLHENPEICLRSSIVTYYSTTRSMNNYTSCENNVNCSRCGSYGLNNNTDDTKNAPCFVMVDVNGDRKPFPKNASCMNSSCKNENILKYADPQGTKLTDLFSIMITDKQAIPFGVAAQKAMYEAQTKK